MFSFCLFFPWHTSRINQPCGEASLKIRLGTRHQSFIVSDECLNVPREYFITASSSKKTSNLDLHFTQSQCLITAICLCTLSQLGWGQLTGFYWRSGSRFDIWPTSADMEERSKILGTFLLNASMYTYVVFTIFIFNADKDEYLLWILLKIERF